MCDMWRLICTFDLLRPQKICTLILPHHMKRMTTLILLHHVNWVHPDFATAHKDFAPWFYYNATCESWFTPLIWLGYKRFAPWFCRITWREWQLWLGYNTWTDYTFDFAASHRNLASWFYCICDMWGVIAPLIYLGYRRFTPWFCLHHMKRYYSFDFAATRELIASWICYSA